jgi:putative tryptophan/tyrosine transport system substrate-binding protein
MQFVQLKRREFISLLGAAAAWPLAARGQQSTKVPRIGFLITAPLANPQIQVILEAFRQGLHEFGYKEGQNIVIEYRTAEGNFDRFSSLAQDLIGLNVDLVLASNSVAARAVHQASSTIPIVVPVMGDPVEDALVASIARPGGNITGLTFLAPELVPKRLNLLKEAFPDLSRVAGLWHSGGFGARTTTEMLQATKAAASTLGTASTDRGAQFRGARQSIFDPYRRPSRGSVAISECHVFFQRERLVEFANQQRLPAMFHSREFAEVGGLMAYGTSIPDLFRRSTAYIDRILRGSKPADLPVEQPTKFELFINLKTAKTLGLNIAPMLLARADEVIE